MFSALKRDLSGASPLDVLLVLRSYAELYPPTVNQANLLAESGLRVGLVELSTDGVVEALNPAVHRLRAHRWWNSKHEPPPPLLRRLVHRSRFQRVTEAAIKSAHPRVVLAYDTLASVFVKPQPSRFRTAYHFHELPEADPAEGVGASLARHKTARFSRQADLVVFSDAIRAQMFQAQVGLRAPPRVVMNCPRRMAQVPASPLRQQLALNTQLSTLNLQPSTQIVCYLGSIGKDQGILPAVLSMRFWPSDVIFVLVGNCSAEMRQLLLEAATQVGAGNRVLLLGARPQGEALALVAGGDVGLSLIQPNTQNWRYSAGAINKRFEYMALGLAQVTSNSPGVAEIIECNQCGLCVESRSPEAIGAAVRRLLEDDALRNYLSSNARACHLRLYNYENQFAEVADWIESACRPSHDEH